MYCYTYLILPQQSDERLARLEAQIVQLKENVNMKNTPGPAWHLPATIIITLLLICGVIFLGIFVLGEQYYFQVWLRKII